MDNAGTANHIRSCDRCGLRYDWRKSTSTNLKMTYCGSLCERGALGFTLDAMLQGTVVRTPRADLFRPKFPSWPLAA
jgi:PHP family Zn ribbon phosphoesterase